MITVFGDSRLFEGVLRSALVDGVSFGGIRESEFVVLCRQSQRINVVFLRVGDGCRQSDVGRRLDGNQRCVNRLRIDGEVLFGLGFCVKIGGRMRAISSGCPCGNVGSERSQFCNFTGALGLSDVDVIRGLGRCGCNPLRRKQS